MNSYLVLALLAAAVAVRAYRRRALAASALGRPLALAGTAFLIAQLAARIAGEASSPLLSSAAAMIAALFSLALWDALVTLALHEMRGRAWIVNAVAGALAVWTFQSGGNLILPVMLANLALARWRGPKATWTRDRWAVPEVRWAVPGAAALVVLEAVLWFSAPRGAFARPSLHFVQWTCLLAAIQAAQELPAMVRQSALSVRRVRKRLALLFALAAFVPLALTGALWALTTWLGVGAEDALIAARALRENAAILDRSLAAAHSSDPTLAGYSAHWRSNWPGGDLWLRVARPPSGARSGNSLQPRWLRLTGRDSVDVRALDNWQPSDTMHVAVLDGRSHLIATHLSTADSSFAVALVPVTPLLRGRIARTVGVRLILETDFPSIPGTMSAADSMDEDPDTAPLPARRPGFERETPREPPALPQARWIVAAPGRNAQSIEAATPRSGLFTGRATVPARVWSHDHWVTRFALLAAQNDARRIFLGLYRDVGENPFAIVPLATLLFVFSIFVFVLVFDFRMVRDLGRSVSGAVATLREGTAALERGDLSHRIEVRGHDDLWEVAGAFNRMAAGLERGRDLEAERRRIEGELALARRIQARLLPGAPPQITHLEIAGVSESAREVGGDYYDHFLLADGRVALAVADVSGKGMPAALLMSAVRAALITQPVERESPGDVLTRIHRFLHRSVEPGRFVTAFLAFLDPVSGRLEYCNAGHNPPIVCGADGSVTRLECGGLILGIVEDTTYETGELQVSAGSLLTLFTDGVTEAQNPASELWGEEPLIELLRHSGSVPLSDLAAQVLERVRAFEAGSPASDDVTLLLARRR